MATIALVVLLSAAISTVTSLTVPVLAACRGTMAPAVRCPAVTVTRANRAMDHVCWNVIIHGTGSAAIVRVLYTVNEGYVTKITAAACLVHQAEMASTAHQSLQSVKEGQSM